jgi:hypothetical protein
MLAPTTCAGEEQTSDLRGRELIGEDFGFELGPVKGIESLPGPSPVEIISNYPRLVMAPVDQMMRRKNSDRDPSRRTTNGLLGFVFMRLYCREKDTDFKLFVVTH